MTNPKTKREQRRRRRNKCRCSKNYNLLGIVCESVHLFCFTCEFILQMIVIHPILIHLIIKSNVFSLSLLLSLFPLANLHCKGDCTVYILFLLHSRFDLWDIFPFFKLVLTCSEESLEKIKTINKNEYVYCRDGGIWNWNDVMCASFRVVLSHCWPTAVTLSHVCLFPSLPVSSCPLCHYSVRQ